MVKERGVSEVDEGSVFMADKAVIVVPLDCADGPVTLGACWAALAFGVALLAAGLGGLGEDTVPPAEAATIEGAWTRTCPPIGRTVCICVGPAFTRLITLC